MRWVVVTILAAALLVGGEGAALAKRVPCKKVMEAIASGKTAEEAAAELGTKLKRVETCMRKKGKKAGAAAGSAGDGSAGDEDGED